MPFSLKYSAPWIRVGHAHSVFDATTFAQSAMESADVFGISNPAAIAATGMAGSPIDEVISSASHNHHHHTSEGISTHGVYSTFLQTFMDGMVNSSLSPSDLAGSTPTATPGAESSDMAAPSFLTAAAAPAVTIADGATVEIDGASAQSVTFTGTTGTLKLDSPLSFSGQISGLTGSDAIDLANISYGANTTAVYSGNANSGTLTVSDGPDTAQISLLGNYLQSGWTLSSDGNGGTIVVDPPLFPDATTTGVPAGTQLTKYNGTLVVTTPGAVIEGLDITGGVIIQAPNVTIKNCVITSNQWYVVLFDWSTNSSNGTVENCEIYGSGSNIAPGNHGVVGGHLVEGNNIHDVEQGIAPESGSTIQGNYVHDLNNPQSDPHYDGILILGNSSNITITGNTIINQHTQTDAIMIQNPQGPVSNIIVDNNKLIGGGYTVYSDASHSNSPITGVQITNNDIGRGLYGPVYFTGNTPVYSGNIDDTTGQLLPGQQASIPALAITAFSTDSNIVGDHITNDHTLTLSGTAPANDSIKVFDGTKQIGTTTANASGAWSFNTATLADGTHNFTISVTANGTSTTSAVQTVTVDTIAPASPSIVNDSINGNKVTLNGTAEANSTVQVSDGATHLGTVTTNGSGAWTFTTAALTAGTHNFTATAMDAAGNISGASTAQSVTLASQAPAAPIIESFSTDSGTVGDHITNDNTLTLTGTAAANSTVKVYDGATLLGTVTANSGGAWNYTTAALTDGVHSLAATATLNGTTSAFSTALTETIDTVAPVAPVIIGDTISSTDRVTLNGTAEANSTVTVLEGTNVLGTTAANSSGAWSFTTPSLAEGKHDFTATATDAAGNTSVLSAPLDPVIGASASTGFPDATNTGVPAGVTLTPYYGDLVITTAGAVIEGLDIHGSVTIAADNVTLLNCKVTTSEQFVVNSRGATGTIVQNCELNGLGGTSNSMGIIGGQGTFQGNNIYNVENGINVEASGVLIKDNYIHSLSASGSPHYDGIQMSGGFNDITILHNTVIAVSDGISGNAAVYATNDFGGINNVVVEDNQLIGGAFTCFVDYKPAKAGTLTGIQFTNNVISPGWWGYVTFLNGNTSNLVWQGNSDLATGQAVANDNTLSHVSDLPAITTFSTDSGIAGDHITNDNTPTLSGTAPANSTVKIFDGTTQVGTTTANASGAWSFSTAKLADGSHSFSISVTSNGVTTTSTVYAVTVDTKAPSAPTIAPSFSTDSGKVGDHITNDNTLALTGTAEANSKVTVSDGTKVLGTATANGSGAWSYTTAALGNGDHNLTATATDAAGNTSVASSALSVTIDTIAPSAPVIATDVVNANDTVSLTGTAEANSTVTVFDGTTALGTATANGSGAWSFTTAALGNGAHDLTATATDAAGNTSTTSQVVDPVIGSSGPAVPAVPVIAAFSTDSGKVGDHITNDNTLTLTGTAEANSTVTVSDGTKVLGTATANGSGAWSYTTAALDNGVHNLTATDTDAAGNTSAASSALSVTVDTIAPTAPVIATDAINTNNTVSLTGMAEANSTVTVFDGTKVLGTTTANGSGAWGYTTAALSTGTHDLTATDTDAAGNTSAASTDQSLTITNPVTSGSTGHHHHFGWSSHSFTWGSTAPTTSSIAATSVTDTSVSPQVASAQTTVNDTLPLDTSVYSDLATTMAQATQNDPSVVTAADPHHSGSFHNAMLSHLTKADFHWG
jgi:hypothetical protein